MLSYRASCEGDLYVGVDQVLGGSPEGVLEVGHDGRVHPGQSVGAVDPDDVLGPLTLSRNAVRK